MAFTQIISLIVLSWFNLFSLSKAIESCPNGTKTCRAELVQLTWCCQGDEICGKSYGQCLDSSGSSLVIKFIIISFSICISICFIRYIIKCMSCKDEQNEPSTNNIYQPIATINPTILPLPEQESPPSYEQVMNTHHIY